MVRQWLTLTMRAARARQVEALMLEYPPPSEARDLLAAEAILSTPRGPRRPPLLAAVRRKEAASQLEPV